MKAGSKRSGLTLLEVMIVLAISVSLLAIAWPRVRRLTERSALKQAALEVKSALAEARDLAIRQGSEVILTYVPSESQFSIATSLSEQTDDRDVSRLDGRKNPFMQVTEDPTAANLVPSNQGHLDVRRLPEDVVFRRQGEEIDRDLVTLSPAAKQPNSQASRSPEQFVRFFPDGRTSSANIQLFSPQLSRSISIEVRGLTGGSKIGSIERSPSRESSGSTFIASSEGEELP